MSKPEAHHVLGIDLNLDEDDLISDALIIMKVCKPDGSAIVAVRASDGLDWITQRGMLAAANLIDEDELRRCNPGG